MGNKLLALSAIFAIISFILAIINLFVVNSNKEQRRKIETYLNAFSSEQLTCGNGIREGKEECDGQDFRGLTCAHYGYDTGELTCSNRCIMLKTNCYNDGHIAISVENATPSRVMYIHIWPTDMRLQTVSDTGIIIDEESDDNIGSIEAGSSIDVCAAVADFDSDIDKVTVTANAEKTVLAMYRMPSPYSSVWCVTTNAPNTKGWHAYTIHVMEVFGMETDRRHVLMKTI